jgi:enterochelin esterase family protein
MEFYQPTHHIMNCMPGSQIIIENIYSIALEHNALNDPVERRVPVYLPAGYSPESKYPVIYLLAAFGNRGLKFLNDDLWEENIQQRLDRLIASGAMRPTLVVMPDASTRYGGSQYLNSAALGDYEDAMLELVGVIDRKYSTLPARGARAVVGHSSGGYGALRLAMRQPGTFGLAAAHSADLDFELAYRPEFGGLLRYYENVGLAGLQTLLADPATALRQGAPYSALSLLASAAAYAPNAHAPLGFDLPIDLHTGAWRPEIWQRWLAHDLLHMLAAQAGAQHAEALRSLHLLYLDCGRYDEYNLLYGARQFSGQLRQQAIAYQYEEYEGGHRHMKHRYDTSFTAVSAAFQL